MEARLTTRLTIYGNQTTQKWGTVLYFK